MFESGSVLLRTFKKRSCQPPQKFKATELNDKLILENVLYSVDVAIVATDLNYRIIYSNPSTSRILGYYFNGYDKDSITDLCLKLALEPDYLEQITDEIRNEGLFQFSLKLDRDDGLIYVECKFSGIWDEHGELIGFLLMAQDVTEREEGSAALRSHRAELAQVARLNVMGEMASSLAHELNQPLTVIASYCDAALNLINSNKETCSDRILNTIKQSRLQALRAGEIIRGIRQLVRKENGKRRPVSINRLMNSVIKLVEAEIHGQEIILRRSMKSGLPLVSIDRIQIEQVILNLLRNALESMGTYGELVVSTMMHESGKKVLVSVQDNGPGFSEGMVDRLFDPFFTTKPNGLGMGLSISKTIVEIHGGSLWAENVQPHGALFCLTLPVVVE